MRNWKSVFAASLVFLFVLSAFLVPGIEPAAAATSHVALDGIASGSCGGCTSVTVTLTTASSNDIIVVSGAYGNCPSPNTPKDTAGLAYKARGEVSYCANLEVEESYAIAPSALSSDRITCSSESYSWISCTAFGVSGANTANPFDLSSPEYTSTSGGQPNCPENNGNLGGLYPCVTSLSTSHADDFVFDVGSDTGSKAQTAGSGFTLIADTTAEQDAYVQYKVPTSALSDNLEPFGTACSVGFVVLGDAVQPATSASSTSSTSSNSVKSTTTTSTTSTLTTTTTSSSTSATTSKTTTSSSTSTSKTTSTSSSTTTTATTSSTTKTAGTGTPGDGVFYLGAKADGPSVLPNKGVRSSIQVQSFNVPVGCVSFWVSDDSAANLWMQVGYYICDGSTPVVFAEVWSLTSYTELYTNVLSITPTSGVQQFAVYLKSGTTWVATYDGTVVGSYDLGASVSSSTYPVYAVSEECALAAPITIPATSFSVAIQVLVNGVWIDPPTVSVYNYGGTWGLQGPAQNPLMAADSFTVGGTFSSPGNGSPL